VLRFAQREDNRPTEQWRISAPHRRAGDGVQGERFLSSHDLHRARGRHLHRQELAAKGLKIAELESDPALQDAVLTVHHACMLTVGNHPTNKLIENHKA
jgi:hypothetical protein